MVRNQRKLVAGAIGALMLAAAGCSSSPSSSGTSSTTSTTSTGSSQTSTTAAPVTVTIGVLTDLTGPAASGNKTSVMGVKAGVAWAAQHGYNVKFVVADTQTNPSNVLTAAQRLVEQDHVVAVIADSALTFAAAPYLETQGIPVIGAAEDASEWTTDKNMFSVFGALHGTEVANTYGLFFKKEGVTNLGALGYGIAPESAEATEASADSAKAEGIKVGYENSDFAFGSTNVEPVALAMKSAHVNGVITSVDPNTSFALETALEQLGVPVKAFVFPTGYGNDLLTSGAGAIRAAQGAYFTLSFEPVEMHTAATEQFESSLKAAGINAEPTFAEYIGYTSVLMLVQGLQAAGANPTSASLLAALQKTHSFTAGGLLGSETLDPNNRSTYVTGVNNCIWMTKFSGTTFTPVTGATPICGTVIAGKTVSS